MHAKLTEFRKNYHETITVLVDPDKTPFTVHKATICAKSKFFQAALSRDWKEAKEATVSLPDLEPHEFAIFVHWMYTGEIDGEELGFDPPHFCGDDRVYSVPLSAFVAGDLLEAESLRNDAMTELIRVERSQDKLASTATISHYWRKTAESSPLRRWLVDLHASVANESFLMQLAEKGPLELIQRVLGKLVQIRNGAKKEIPKVATACKYHDHKETPKCLQSEVAKGTQNTPKPVPRA